MVRLGGVEGIFEPKTVEHQLHRVPFYLRLMSVSKMVLGFAVVALIAIVIAIPFLKPPEEGIRIAISQMPEGDAAKAEQPVMRNPRFESVDNDNQPYTVRAETAVQIDESQVQLNKIKADISLSDGLWLALSAQTGLLNLETQRMQLNDAVQVNASNGYEIQAPQAEVDIKAGRASGSAGILAQGELGTIRAQQFVIDGKTSRVLFKDQVRLTIYP